MDVAEKIKKGRTHQRRVIRVMYIGDFPTDDDPDVERLRGDTGEPTARSAPRFTKNTLVSSDLVGHQTETYL